MKRNDITLAQLEVLVAVVQHKSFTAAANALSITQSAASHALASLEAELDNTLVERSRHGVVLTDIGARVFEHAQTILLHTESIRQETAAHNGLAAGKLRIGSFPSVSAQLLPSLIRSFQQRYRGIEIVMFEGTDQEVYDWIFNRIVDVGFVTQITEHVEKIPIAQDELLLLVSEGHHLADRSAVSIQELAEEPFIISKAGCEPLVLALFQSAKVALQPQFEVSDATTILAMVREGMGITIVPQLVLPDELPGIKTVGLTPQEHRHLALGVRSLHTMLPLVNAFMHHAQGWARAQGYITT
ncbi:MAG: LysR family transcriptional regulator [Chloroflexota bacterium]